MAHIVEIPHLRVTQSSSQLYVHGKPFLCLGAELHNSSFSDPEYLSSVWPPIKAMNVNTVLGAVTWQMIQPEEGQFDFSILDRVILDARTHGIHVILLWFGSFKNATSTYVPSWVKKDVRRFSRVHVHDRTRPDSIKTIELLSPFCSRNWEADGKAFAALMKHLQHIDEMHSTVLMVQVENETGMLGDTRDRSRIADNLFTLPVPEQLLNSLQASSSLHPLFRKHLPNVSIYASGARWEEVFGLGAAAEEMFMADAFSKYVGHVAAAGKAEYPLPLYTNAWLNFDDPDVLDLTGITTGPDTPVTVGGGAKPGDYPSGGPCPHTLDIWRANAPALDFIAPDLYIHDYEWVCQQYRYGGQPLFISEQQRTPRGALRVMLAYGTYGAVGCCPFGIDTLDVALNPWTKVYDLLNKTQTHIVHAQTMSLDKTMGFYFDEPDYKAGKETWTRVYDDVEITVRRAFVFGKPSSGCGIIIHRDYRTFLLLGWGYEVKFQSVNSNATFTGIEWAEEKLIDVDGNLRRGRILNGDEISAGASLIMPNDNPDYGDFPIAVTIPARTYIAECKIYSIEETSEDW